MYYILVWLAWWFSSKESACQWGRFGFNPWVWKIPWRKIWQPTPGSLPGKSHGQRSLAGYSPWGCKRVGHDLEAKEQQKNIIPCLERQIEAFLPRIILL